MSVSNINLVSFSGYHTSFADFPRSPKFGMGSKGAASFSNVDMTGFVSFGLNQLRGCSRLQSPSRSVGAISLNSRSCFYATCLLGALVLFERERYGTTQNSLAGVVAFGSFDLALSSGCSRYLLLVAH